MSTSRQSNAIEVRDLQKAFRVPVHRVDTLKERATHPLRPTEYRQLHALRGISFDVAEGEFFGVVGRNGSGKSTLLKLLASIYRPDGGSIKVAGRLSPFIELGVGFNMNMTARDNILLNGVMLGLSPREARRRTDAVIEFAELEDFVEMKLKNYSSGMVVRLGFSLMIQVDADVLLIDEVLAVGDASFQRKCTDAFERLHAEGRAIVFVTHNMSMMARFCDRALLLDDGRIAELGDPARVGQRYVEINLARRRPESAAVQAGFADVWIEDEGGTRANEFARAERIYLNALIKADQPVEGPAVAFGLTDQEGTRVYTSPPHRIGDTDAGLAAGERRRVRVRIENPLASGQYRVDWTLFHNGASLDVLEATTDPAGLTVSGRRSRGIVDLSPKWNVDEDRAPDLSAR